MRYYICRGESGRGDIEVRIISKSNSGRVVTAYPLKEANFTGYKGCAKFTWGRYGDVKIYDTAASILADCLRDCPKRVQLMHKKFANDVVAIRMAGHLDACGLREDWILNWMAEQEMLMGDAMRMC